MFRANLIRITVF